MCSNGGLSHFDGSGNARMVDISEKDETSRSATAVGIVEVKPDTFDLIEKGEIGKGDVLGVSRVAGIMAAKKTWEIIPMCHPLAITGSDIDFILDREQSRIRIEATVKTYGKTGVEMEALTAATAAGLTIYDMCKAVDKDIKIKEIHLLKKTGGKSGTYERTVE